MVRQAPADDVAGRVQVGAPVVGDHALGVAGGAAGVVQRDGVPFVLGQRPGVLRVAGGQEGLVAGVAQVGAFGGGVVLHLHHIGAGALQQVQGLGDDAGELAVGQQHLGFTMLQHEGDGLGVEPGVQRVEHGAGHGHAEVRLEHRRHIGQHHRHRVVLAHATRGQGAGQPAAAGVGVAPGLAPLTIDDGHPVRVHMGCAFDVAQRGQRHMVGGILLKAQVVGRSGVAHRSLSAVKGQNRPTVPPQHAVEPGIPWALFCYFLCS